MSWVDIVGRCLLGLILVLGVMLIGLQMFGA
jgi:hypothetical protein